jgi:hypothetical protein
MTKAMQKKGITDPIKISIVEFGLNKFDDRFVELTNISGWINEKIYYLLISSINAYRY